MNRILNFPIYLLPICALMAITGASWVIAKTFPSEISPIAFQQGATDDPPTVKLQSAIVTFHTKDDDKDPDTTASLEIKLPDGMTVIAKITAINDQFGNNSISKAYPFTDIQQIPKDQLQGCTITVKTMRMEGHDQWKFDYEIRFTFSDGSVTPKLCLDNTMNEGETKVCPY